MARVDAEIDKLEQLTATEVTAVNRLALHPDIDGCDPAGTPPPLH